MASVKVLVVDDTHQPPLLVWEGESGEDAANVAARYARQTGRPVVCYEAIQVAEVGPEAHPEGHEPNPPHPLRAKQ